MKIVEDVFRPDLGGNIRHGDTNSWSPRLWRYLVDRFGVSSILDVGCGEGHSTKFFHRLGLVAHGVDGSMDNIRKSVFPIALHDLLKGPYVMPVDLVWCCEVAEHIDPAFVENFIATLANGRVIAMTHAMPGQIGHHHVNCQPPEYWIEWMARYNYTRSDDTPLFREIAARDENSSFFANSGIVFTRN